MLLVSVLPGSNFSCLALLPSVSATTARALPLMLLARLLVSPPLCVAHADRVDRDLVPLLLRLLGSHGPAFVGQAVA